MLDQLLEYHETPDEGDFTARVMKRVNHQQRMRRLILVGSGVVGASFGVAGMLILSEPLTRLLNGNNIMPASVAAMAAIGLVFWLLQDEAAATG